MESRIPEPDEAGKGDHLVRREPLPIDDVLQSLCEALAASPRVVLQAPPGAGKTTRVPLALLGEPWLAGAKILMLEPRRIAARAAARRMAQSLGEEVGETVGYRVRMDSRVGPRTRIEVITDGVFTRMIQDRPDLEGVGAVLFDEFHERSLDGDLGLALCLEAQEALRPDLRVVPMSATLDGASLASFLGGCPVIESEGRAYPVTTRWQPRDPRESFEIGVARAIRSALEAETGGVLVFLPGTGEIRRVANALSRLPSDVDLVMLYGDLSASEQDRAIRPAPEGRRKLVLATSIAETSLTIEGIRIVIDGGQSRSPRFDPGSGMTRLVTLTVPRSNADQRRGRAGRTASGVCIRMWGESEDRALAPFAQPEIATADLTPLALELALWGEDAGGLRWLDPPPAAALAHARTLLQDLEALDPEGRITPRGRLIARLPAHPRLASMLLVAGEQGDGALACLIAALIGERDLLRGGPRDVDLRTRVALLLDPTRTVPAGVDRGALATVLQRAGDLRRRLKVPDRIAPGALERVGELVALAFPDRIAKRRPGGDPRFLMLCGRGAVLDPVDPLAAEIWLAIADLDGGGRESRVWSAVPLDGNAYLTRMSDRIETVSHVVWDDANNSLVARRTSRLGPIVLRDEPLPNLPSDQIGPAVIAAIRQRGVGSLTWNGPAERLRERLRFARTIDGDVWPDVSDAGLAASLEDWLGPGILALPRLSAFSKLDLEAALLGFLTYVQRRELDLVAPERLTVPSGSSIAIDYSAEVPVAAVKLQEMFGARLQPSVGRGRVPLLLHLLSPAGRPIQVTRDIGGFWTTSYAEVRKDLRGRYPKHPWPEDPINAIPTRHTKARQGSL